MVDKPQRRRSSLGITPPPLKADDPSSKLIDQMLLSLRRREIVGSLNVALATAFLLHTVTKNANYSTIEELLAITKAIGRQMSEANPKELASGNIVRRVLRLIREEYRAAAVAHASAPPSAPETPYLGPTTPGLPAPANHYLSNDLSFSHPAPPPVPAPLPSVGLSKPPSGSGYFRPALPHAQTSLSNFVAMRHSRVQNHLERTGSVFNGGGGNASASAGAGGGGGGAGVGFSLSAALTMSPSPSPAGLPNADLSLSTGSLPGPSRSSSVDGLGAASGVTSPTGLPVGSEDFMRQSSKLRPVLLQAIEEVISELETTRDDVARSAKEHIHSSEVILTIGHSKTVEAFLKQAARDRKFTVVVAESAPTCSGAILATSLANNGIPTLLIPDSSLLALLPRITKLILGCHTVLANGGLFALSGTLGAVLAARAHAKPIMVTTGQFKFAPVWNRAEEFGAVDYQSPGMLRLSGGVGSEGWTGGYDEGVEGEMPYWEYIRPELIDLFVTNEGDHAPAYIYRLTKEAYDEEDLEL